MENNDLKKRMPIRDIRESQKLSRRKVSAFIGISERALQNVEDGTSIPQPEVLANLAKLYKKSLKVIFESVGIDVTDVPDDR